MDDFHERKLDKAKNINDIDSAHLNPQTKKLLKEEFAHEYQKISKYSEGRCYGCAFNDKVHPVTMDVCYTCIGKRGDYTDSSLITFVKYKPEVYCGFCGKWVIGGAHLNARICHKCEFHVIKHQKDYRKQGGMMSNPFYKYLKRKQGNEWKALEMESWRSPRK